MRKSMTGAAPISYRRILREYWKEYERNFGWRKLVILLLFWLEALNPFREEVSLTGMIAGIPILLTLLSGAFHNVALPAMMYVIPYTKQMREEYIQKLLYVKIAVPLLTAAGVDLCLLAVRPDCLRAVVLQIFMVFFVAAIMGMLNDGKVFWNERKTALGKLKDYDDAILVVCYVGSLVMYVICSSESILDWEFIVVWVIMLLVYGILFKVIAKRWKELRANFADYEIMSTASSSGVPE